MKPLHPIYTEKTTEKTTESKLASSDNSDDSEQDNPWERTFGVDDEPRTFLERVWSLYCDNYDANETIALDDSRWRPFVRASSSGSVNIVLWSTQAKPSRSSTRSRPEIPGNRLG